MEYMPLVSIVLELIITVFFIQAAMRGQSYFFGLALAFGIYVYYDLQQYYMWEVSGVFVSGIFLLATLGALYSAYYARQGN